ncbi:MAG: hypothetical protein LUH09_05505 [Clostridiales bacterium]|nr:hypothetical protein [Clostridiales bacterium]
MERDFTQAKLEELKAQIEQIEQTDFCWLTDALGDAWYYVKEVAGWLDIENYLDDVEEYHKEVLDQHNTTNARLEALFEAAQAVDDNFQPTFSEFSENIGTLTKKMEALTGSIDPNGGPFTRENILNACIPLNEEIDAAQTTMDTIFDAEISYLENEVAKDAALGLAKDIVSVAVTICSLPVDLIKSGPAGFVNSTWKLINRTFTTGQDLVALGMIGVGKIVGAVSDDKSKRIKCLEEASDYESRSGLADEVEDTNETAANVIRAVDSASATYDIVNGITGAGEKIGDGISKWDIINEFGISNPNKGYEQIEAAEKLGKVATESDIIAASLTQEKSIASNIGTAANFAISILDDGIDEAGKELLGNTTWGKVMKKTADIMENVEKIFDVQEGEFKQREVNLITVKDLTPPSAHPYASAILSN